MGDLSADLVQLLSEEQLESLDLFDRCQLERVVATCARCRSLSEAGRLLFHNSRSRKSSPNDADRLRKYLARFGLDWNAIAGKPG
jgi:transcriptional regulatory protein RtcR